MPTLNQFGDAAVPGDESSVPRSAEDATRLAALLMNPEAFDADEALEILRETPDETRMRIEVRTGKPDGKAEEEVKRSTKFLAQLRVLERERLALYEEILDPESKALQRDYLDLSREFGGQTTSLRHARKELSELQTKSSAAGLDPDEIKGVRKSQYKNACATAASKLRKAVNQGHGRGPLEAMVKEALSVLERVL